MFKLTKFSYKPSRCLNAYYLWSVISDLIVPLVVRQGCEGLAGRHEVEVRVRRVQAVGRQWEHGVGVDHVSAVATQVRIVLQVPGVDVVPGQGAGRVAAVGGRAGAVHPAEPARRWYPVGGRGESRHWRHREWSPGLQGRTGVDSFSGDYRWRRLIVRWGPSKGKRRDNNL